MRKRVAYMKKVVMRCQEEIQEADHAGITQIHSIIHLYCSGWPRPSECIINKGLFKEIRKNI